MGLAYPRDATSEVFPPETGRVTQARDCTGRAPSSAVSIPSSGLSAMALSTALATKCSVCSHEVVAIHSLVDLDRARGDVADLKVINACNG